MSTLLHRLFLSIEQGTVQTGTGKVDPTRKLKCTTAARDLILFMFLKITIWFGLFLEIGRLPT